MKEDEARGLIMKNKQLTEPTWNIIAVFLTL